MERRSVLLAGLFAIVSFSYVYCSETKYEIITEKLTRQLFSLADTQELVIEKYKVQRGDTMLEIARRKYENPSLWKVIARLNPQISNPNRINPGDILSVPVVVERQADTPPATPDSPKTDAAALKISNFDSGAHKTLLGDVFGTWDRDPNDHTQGCVMVFAEGVSSRDKGTSIKLEYDVDSPNPAYNGFWMKLGARDFSTYSSFCFSVKGDSTSGFTEKFKVELKNGYGQIGTYMVSGITDEWKEIVIPFEYFRGLRNLNNIDEFVIVFEDSVARPKEGAIYLDNIYVR